MTMTDEDFNNLYHFIRQNYGINLSKKKQLVVSRLQTWLSEKDYGDFHSFVVDVVGGRRPDLIPEMLDKLTTNYTYFLREKEHFDFLSQTIIPWMKARHKLDRTISVWSAGCSSGEEPYTISMYLQEAFGSTWDTRVLATDLSMDILNQAIHPSYTKESLATLPAAWKNKYFMAQTDGSYTVRPLLRDNVIFKPFNLMNPIHFRKKFDLIFCRNVMIYFNQETKNALVDRFYDATVPGGYLFIGHSEGINKYETRYEYIKPAIYRKLQ